MPPHYYCCCVPCGQWLYRGPPHLSCAAEVKPVRGRAPLSVNHPECTLHHTSLHPSTSTYGHGNKSWLSPRKAVTSVGVTVPCAVTWATAVFMKPPVSQHAAVAAGASDAGLTSALPTAGVAERATTWEDGADRVAGTGCRGEGDRIRRAHVNISVRQKTCLRLWRHSVYIMSVFKGQIHPPREITKVICILSSSCNKRQAGSMYSTCFMQQTQTVNHHALRCRICCLMVARDDRLIFVTDPLHLLPKTACLCL